MKKNIKFTTCITTILMCLICFLLSSDSALAGSNKGSRDWKWPVPASNSLSSCYLDGRAHYALDIAAAKGSSVYASYPGTVLAVSSSCSHNYGKNASCGCNGGQGNYVYIKHSYQGVSFVSRYIHLSTVNVSAGSTVTKNTIIGTVGSTGYSAGFHLDFRIYQGSSTAHNTSQCVDPFMDQFLEMPNGLNANSASTGCCYEYVKKVVELYIGQCIGNSDEITGGTDSVYVKGWVYDPDTLDKSVTIHIYVDGKHIGSAIADQYRPDVNKVMGCGDYHGYSVTVSYSVTTSGEHEVAVYALDTSGINNNPLIKAEKVTIKPNSHKHSYTSKVTKEPGCTTTGVRTYTCSCGHSYTETIAAKGHSYTSKVTKQPGCTTTGVKTYTCGCGHSYTETIAATGHNYTHKEIPATCISYAKIVSTCGNCGDTYESYNGYSDWSTTKPSVDASLIQTKTQYRYSDYQTKTSYESSLSGYTLLKSEWEKSGSGKIEYVKSWPSGFSTSSSLYATYNKTPKKASETEKQKVTIDSDKITGYLYYHWCRGTLTSGPSNRATRPSKSGEFTAWHVFYSTTPPSSLTVASDGDGSYKHPNASCCKDSYWYYVVPVYTQTYTTYQKLYTYYRWTAWSSWSDTKYTASNTRKVETRTLYRYVNTKLADHSWEQKAESRYLKSKASCTSAAVYYKSCKVCGVAHTKETFSYGKPLDHVRTPIAGKTPTCKESGLTEGVKCTSCGQILIPQEEIPSSGEHEYVRGVCKHCGDDLVESFVARFYTTILGRTPDMNGLTYWADRLKGKTATAAEVAMLFIDSDEFIGLRLGRLEFLNRMYATFFGRGGDEGGMAYWMNYLEKGVSRKYVAAQFICSNEFAEICNAYEIIRGDVVLTDYVDQNVNLTMYVHRCYTEILQRPAEEDGMEWWCEQIYTGQKSAIEVATSFVDSEEFVDRGWSDSEYIKILYRAFMGREYDEAGLTYWLEQLDAGVTRLDAARAFAACKEFQEILAGFGL